jgi:hypothetical protein
MSLIEKDFIVYHIIIGIAYIKTVFNQFIDKLKTEEIEEVSENIDLLDPLKIPKYHSGALYYICINSGYNKLFLLNSKLEELINNLKNGNNYTDSFNLTNSEYGLKEWFSDEDGLNWIDSEKNIQILIYLYKEFDKILKNIDKRKINIAVLNLIKNNLDLTIDSLVNYQEELTLVGKKLWR